MHFGMIKGIPQQSYLCGQFRNRRGESSQIPSLSVSWTLTAQVLTIMAYSHFDGCFDYIQC